MIFLKLEPQDEKKIWFTLLDNIFIVKSLISTKLFFNFFENFKYLNVSLF